MLGEGERVVAEEIPRALGNARASENPGHWVAPFEGLPKSIQRCAFDDGRAFVGSDS